MSVPVRLLNEEEVRILDEAVKNDNLQFLPKAQREAVIMKLKRCVSPYLNFRARA